MRTTIVSSGFIGRYADKDKAIAKANEIGGYPCHLLLQNNGLQATFGFAVAIGDDIIGCDDFKWI